MQHCTRDLHRERAAGSGRHERDERHPPHTFLVQGDVPLDDVDAPLAGGLCDVARGAIGKSRACMRLSREVAFHSGDFDLESFLALFLRYRADAQAYPNSEVSFVNQPADRPRG